MQAIFFALIIKSYPTYTYICFTKIHFMKPLLSFILFGSCLFLFACNSSKNTAKKSNDDLSRFQQLMAGKYNSQAQSIADTNYFNISLVMTPIWKDRTDGKWLYVEQAMASMLDKPYRQRVYHLQHPSSTIYTSDIYTIKDAMTFAGAQNDDAKMQKLSIDKIELKEGCTVTLTANGNNEYVGGTTLDHCPSDLRGAKYATTKITMKNGELISWDQGFDATGKQVWGAEKAGYIFVKQ
jgi:hypothetical protein